MKNNGSMNPDPCYVNQVPGTSDGSANRGAGVVLAGGPKRDNIDSTLILYCVYMDVSLMIHCLFVDFSLIVR